MTQTLVGAVVVLGAIALARWRRLRIEADLAVAALRAALQLVAVALLVTAVFEVLALAGLFITLMLGAATWTTSRRWGPVPGGLRLAAAAVGSGPLVVLAAVFASGAFDPTPRYVIPLAGIVIGGSMTAASLAGRRLREEVDDHRVVIEARLALGVSARQALAPHVRRATVTALIPVVDQTRNVGLVTLPGAFVGMLLGGASPADAAQVQLTVLLLLLGAESIAAVTATEVLARAAIAPGERVVGLGPG